MADGPQHSFTSPLRYPGGKGKVANYIKLLFIHNNFIGHHYVEPYAGGASVALTLLYEEYAAHIHINDLNRSIFAFWNAVLNQTDELCDRIIGTPVTVEEWERQKLIQSLGEPSSIDLAFSTFFLNRTNRSGIIAGGIIGGKKQKGTWKIDARFNTKDLVQRIRKVARYRNRITLSQLNAADYIRNILPNLPRKTFLYLDPPYYVKGKGLYEHFYEHKDHVEISQLVSKVQHPWLVSYDAAPAILELYENFSQINYGLNYSAAERYSGDEIMFFSPEIEMLAITSPANVHRNLVNRARKEFLIFTEKRV